MLLFLVVTLKLSGWCSVIYPPLFLPPHLTVPVFRRLPAYSRVTVYRQERCRRKMKYRLRSRDFRHIYHRQTELPSDICLTVYRQINTGNCRYRQESPANTGYRQKSTANTGYRPKRTVSSLLCWMPRDMWRMFYCILYFLVRRFHWFPFGRTLYACVDVWTGSVAHLQQNAHHITPGVVSRSMSDLLPLQVKRLCLLLRQSRLLLRQTLRKEKWLARLLCRFLFFCFSSGCCLHETAQSRCDEKISSFLPACVGTFFCFSGGCCLHETAQSRCDEKRSSLPACEARTYPTTFSKYRHFSCYRLPTRALPPKNEIPSTAEKLPSCCITAEIFPAYFSFTVSVKAVTVR